MKVLGIIPARYESSRFPGKPLVDLAGKTMIRRVYEGASKASGLTDIIVATDNKLIHEEVSSFGGNVAMTAMSHESGTERCGEILYKMPGYDVVVNIQGDEPLIDPSQIDTVIKLFSKPEVKIGTLVKKIESESDITNPHRIKVVLDKEQNGIYFSRSPIPFLVNAQPGEWLKKAVFYKHLGIYGWRADILPKLLELPPTTLEKTESLEQLRWIYHGYQIRTAETSIETPNIDVPEDVKTVLKAISEKKG
jgi:3-deoxy-manno-octulosonate cytidylyltransferase (CMP-KDO synthetase)